jgi:hypothetical protein
MRSRICLAVGIALAVHGASARGEEQAAESTSPRRESPRALNGLVFQPSRLITGPFSDTSFGMATLFGAGTASAPRYNLAGNQTGTRDYTMAAYGQALDLHLRLTPDVAIRLTVEGTIFSGINGKSLLVAGATAQAGVGAGLTAGRDLSRTLRLSFVGDVGLAPQYSVLIGNAVVGVIQSRSFDSAGLLSTVDRLRAAPGLSLAWAPSPMLGFIAEARYVWTRRVTSDGSDTQSRTAQGVSVGGLAAFDLDPFITFPIALQAIYRGDYPVGNSGLSTVNQAGFGVYYSRRVSLALGLEVLWRHGDIRPGVAPSLKSDAATGALWLRYYW